jgi:two-component system chemotaxis sensor kinase CheA
MPSDRKRAGKDPKGIITLSAKNEGGKVWITVQDDGGGMNREKILEKARKNGLLGRRDEASMTDKEVYQFITYPGFSTKEKVSEYSGRGVGMDVVVQNIQSIGGTLDIDSVPGEGSIFIMKIPLTLAIINGMIMEIAGAYYAIETGSVREFVQVRHDMMIHENESDECVMIRGECYPVIRLSKWFHIEQAEQDIEKGSILMMENEGKIICLFADKLIGEQEIVVKPIPPYIKKIKGLSGCTQLGDGGLALILDPAGFFSV